MPSVILQPTPWPDTLEDWLLLLNIQGGNDIRCHGRKKSKSGKADGDSSQHPCRNKVSQTSWETVKSLLIEVAAEGAIESGKDLLVKAAQLLLCKAAHQDQGPELLARWLQLLTNVEDRPTLVELLEPSVDGQEESSLEVKSFDGPRSAEIVVRAVPVEPKVTPKLASKVPDEHTFESFGPQQTTYAINKAIQQCILKPLTATDLQSRQSGNVYIYTFPNTHRTRSPFLKIGNAKNVGDRMARWKKQCGYVPQILSTFTADFYVRVERLVHVHLRNQRLREPKCPGCGGVHHEWFQVRNTRAAALAGLWTDWTRQQPYDDRGILKESWAKRVSKVNLDDADCWEDFVHCVDEHDDVKEEETDEEQDEDDSKHDLDDESYEQAFKEEDEDEVMCRYNFMDDEMAAIIA